jgi:DNA-directed RNA polymerase specialized sigma24 family protein
VQLSFNNQHKGKWSSSDEDALVQMYLEGRPMQEMADVLRRSLTAIVVKLARLKVHRGIRHRRFRNQHQPVGTFTVVKK